MSPTIPGDIPGLLQRGSPVLVRDHEVHDRAFGGVVLAIVGGDPFLAITDGPAKLVHLPIRIVALDLSDATGRAHAAWWLEARPYTDKFGAVGWWDLITSWMHPVVDGEDNRPCNRYAWEAVCAVLADLDSDDPRLLPDGSSLVAAEAMRRVVLHVAGRPL